MIATRNKRVINNIAFKSLKANKMRNIFAVFAIALTTILFTSLLTMAISMNKSIEQGAMRQVGSYAHGSFKYITTEEFNRIKNHKLIKEIGHSIIVSFAENAELSRRQTEIRYATDNTAKFMFSFPTIGRMPSEKNEIATDTIVLDKLGVKHKIGEIITLNYTVDGKKYADKFILSGFWKGDIIASSSKIWVSEKFADIKLLGIDQKYVKTHMKENGISGLNCADVMFSNSINVEKKLLTILKDNGYTENDIPIGVNWGYSASNLGTSSKTIISLLGAMLVVAISGYLIIYNIFYISITKDTKFYGILKTIGTTPKQIKKIVKKQAIILCAIGIPLGLIIGYILGAVLLPYVMQVLQVGCTEIAFNPLIFVGAIVFSIVTVLISCRKPEKIASNISPIEAVRYTDVSNNINKKSKNSINGAKLYRMALSNIFRNKKKAITVILSLSLSIILLNSVYTIVTSFDMKCYVSGMIESDFAVGDANYFNAMTGYKGQKTLTESIVDEIGAIKGIKNTGRIYFKELKHKLSDRSLSWVKNSIDLNSEDYYTKEAKEVLRTSEINVHLNGSDRFVWNKFEILKGNFNAEKFATGNYILISLPDFKPKFDINTRKMKNADRKNTFAYYDIGEQIKINYGEGKEKTYEVMAICHMPYNLTVKHNHGDGTEVYIPSEEFKVQVSNPVIMTAIFDAEDKYVNTIEKYIDNYTKTKETSISYVSRNSFVKQFEKTQSTYNIVGYSLSFVVALIGILNFSNSMITSIIARKQEHAMFQSIGMTGKQLYKMLIFEGLYYAVFTVFMVITIGTGLNYLIVDVIAGGIWFFSYHFTLVPVMICTPILIAISIIVPIVCYKSSSRMSIVERLREIE